MDFLNIDNYLKKQFKMDVTKSTSQVLNSLLDNEQTKTLFQIKEKKAQIIRKQKFKQFMNAQIQQIKNDMTPSKADSRQGVGNEAGASQNLK